MNITPYISKRYHSLVFPGTINGISRDDIRLYAGSVGIWMEQRSTCTLHRYMYMGTVTRVPLHMYIS